MHARRPFLKPQRGALSMLLLFKAPQPTLRVNVTNWRYPNANGNQLRSEANRSTSYASLLVIRIGTHASSG
jgi:hypothetical protein